MLFRSGIAFAHGGVFVLQVPYLLFYPDRNRDDVPDSDPEVLLEGFGMEDAHSVANSLTIGPDGWLYLTDGRHGFDINTKEGTNLKGLASRIWRVRPDGSQLQSFAGGGFDNPVEVIWTPAGEMIGTMTYFVNPQHGQRDALMHFLHGGVYSKWQIGRAHV